MDSMAGRAGNSKYATAYLHRARIVLVRILQLALSEG